MTEEKPVSFIDRRLIWLEDFKTTVEPIDTRIQWGLDGIKDYGLLLIRNMFVLNAGALVAAPAFATALKEKSQLLSILWWPISLYGLGLVFAIFSAISAHFNFTKGVEYSFVERNLEAHKLSDIHFPATDPQQIEARAVARRLVEEALKAAQSKTRKWFFCAHGFGWLCFSCFASASIIFMWKLAS